MPQFYPRVLSEHATLAQAAQGRSIARYGDGELKLCLGKSIKSQDGNPQIAAYLRTILLDTESKALVCIPRIDPPGVSPKELFWRKFRERRYAGLFSTVSTYGSSFITRPDSAPVIEEESYWRAVRALWAGKDVVLVSGSTKSLVPALMTDARSVTHIEAPRRNAWDVEAQLFGKLLGETRPVILCLGPTATVLAYRLAYHGVHALDLGHVGMFLKRREG